MLLHAACVEHRKIKIFFLFSHLNLLEGGDKMVGCCVRHVHVARQEGVGETGKYSESSGKNRALKK